MASVQSQPRAAAQMGATARRFLDNLTAEQKSRATFEYMDGEGMYWYYPPINRHSLAPLDANPHSTNGEIREDLSSNLCHCNAYGRTAAERHGWVRINALS